MITLAQIDTQIVNKKRCIDCKYLLPFSNFHRDSSYLDGYKYRCKLCRKLLRQKKRKLLSKERKEEIEKVTVEWRKQNPERVKAMAKRGHEKSKRRHPERIKARGRISSLVQRGKLIKPLHCQNCRGFTYVESHHYKGYAPEYALDVVWLCRKCHTQADKLKVS